MVTYSSTQGAGKCAWTLAGPKGRDRKAFQDFVLNDLAKAAARLMPGATGVSVTLQQPDAWSGASVPVENVQQPVDAVLEITVAQPYAPLDPVNAHLSANCGHVQGWRVHPTLIFDASAPTPLGQPSAQPNVLVFLRRLDGATPEHFHHNWYMHAGHPDGQEAESEASRATRAGMERSMRGRYVQNRTLEAITPTAWVMTGYTSLNLPALMTGPVARYERHRGEQIFEEWPPHFVQGPAYQLV